MYIREFHLTAKNKLVIALALVALLAAGSVLFALGMTLLIAALGAAIVAGGVLSARSAIRRAFGRSDAPSLSRGDRPDPAQEVFPSERARTPQIRKNQS